MKFTIAPHDLARASALAAAMSTVATSLPSLANVLITATPNNAVTFQGANPNASVRCTVATAVQTPGACALPAAQLAQLAADLPAPDLTVSCRPGDDVATIAADRVICRLAAYPPDDCIAPTSLCPVSAIVLTQAALKTALSSILYAVDINDPRQVLCGGLFDIHNNTLTCVGTDGKQMAIAHSIPTAIAGAPPISAIVPRPSLAAVHAALAGDGDVRICIGEREVLFDLGGLLYRSNRVDGVYPLYHTIPPSKTRHEIPLDRERILLEARRAAVLAEPRNNSLILRFAPGGLTFHTRTLHLGTYARTIPIQYAGALLELCVNCTYLINTLQAITGTHVLLKAVDDKTPVVFVPPDNPQTLHLIMPVRSSDITYTIDSPVHGYD